MNILLIYPLQAAQRQDGGGGMGLIIMLVLMFVIMYFFMIRPQQKQQKKIQTFRNSLAVGDRVLTGGGVYGVVKDLGKGEPYVTVEIATGVKIKVDRNYLFADAQQAEQGAQQKQVEKK